MIAVIYNLTRQRLWLTLRYDIYRDIVRIALTPSQAPMSPDIELYEDLFHEQYIRLGRPEWSEKTKIEFDTSAIDPVPNRFTEEEKDDDELVRIFTFKYANGAN